MKHQEAKALSRLPSAMVENTEIKAEILVIVVTQIKHHAYMKKYVVPSLTHKKSGLPKNPDELHAGLPLFPEFIIAQFRDVFCK